MSSDIAIRVENLSKCYQIYEQPRDRLKQFIMPRIQRLFRTYRKDYYREFWALKDVSFKVKKGETVGIIGRNGSGKSTLLQLICGTLNPTNGIIQTNGRIAALLELGSGFNPDFTGHENIYMNAAILGLSKEEIDARYDEIVAFADIGHFIEQPVKTYSSGMGVRLAFSVAVHTSPEILVVDEALAVGDFQFQSKCFERIKTLKENGATILLVTHELSAISQFCDHAILISSGKIISEGNTSKVINDFKKISTSNSNSTTSNNPNKNEKNIYKTINSNFYPTSELLHRSGGAEVTIIDWFFKTTSESTLTSTLPFNTEVTLTVVIKSNRTGVNPNVGFFFTDHRGNEIAGSALNHEECFIGEMNEGDVVEVNFTFMVIFKPGRYFLNLGCSEIVNGSLQAYDRLYSLTEIDITGNKDLVGNMYLSSQVSVNFLF